MLRPNFPQMVGSMMTPDEQNGPTPLPSTYPMPDAITLTEVGR